MFTICHFLCQPVDNLFFFHSVWKSFLAGVIPIIKLKKVGKTNILFIYDLKQIPYDYTVKVRNRFKGLDLIDRVPEKLWTEVCDIVQEQVTKTIPKK